MRSLWNVNEDIRSLKSLILFGIRGMLAYAYHALVLGYTDADKVVEAFKSGKIKHFFLVGRCDGARSGRNYYTEFVKQTPADSVIMTLACGNIVLTI